MRVRPSQGRFQIPVDVYELFFSDAPVISLHTGEVLKYSNFIDKEDNHTRPKLLFDRKLMHGINDPIFVFTKKEDKIYYELFDGQSEEGNMYAAILEDGRATKDTHLTRLNPEIATWFQWLKDGRDIVVADNLPKETLAEYVVDNDDTRKKTLRMVSHRKQSYFRKIQFNRFGGKCMITGEDTTHVLQAAHIRDHLGDKDNHPHNGCLLEANLHILFDKGMLGIDPDSTTVFIHPSVKSMTFRSLHGKKLNPSAPLSKEALTWKWNKFKEKLDFHSIT